MDKNDRTREPAGPRQPTVFDQIRKQKDISGNFQRRGIKRWNRLKCILQSFTTKKGQCLILVAKNMEKTFRQRSSAIVDDRQ